MEESKYGILVNADAKLYRQYFKEMVRLLGVQAIYLPVLPGKDYDLNGFIKTNHGEGIKIGCIFEDHPSHQTTKKLGWDAELSESAALIHLPYDLPDLQIGSLFILPSAYDNTPGRLFRVTKMSTQMIYPASITCEVVPEYIDETEPSEIELFNNTNFNLLNEG